MKTIRKIRQINLHAGFPRIGPPTLRQIVPYLKLADPTDTVFVPNEYFVRHLRPAINTYHLQRYSSTKAEISMEGFIDDCGGSSTIVLSQPGMLGHPQDLIVPGRQRNRAYARMRSLSTLLDDQPLCVHLLIEPQADYLTSLQKTEAPNSELATRSFSWVDLISGFQKCLNNHQLTVWDFRDAQRIENDFLTTMMGQAVYYSASKPLLQSNRATPEVKVARREEQYRGRDDLIKNLDEVYEADLDTIDALPGVTLVR